MVGCLAAALARAGGGEVFEDQSVGHGWCGWWIGAVGDIWRCGSGAGVWRSKSLRKLFDVLGL